MYVLLNIAITGAFSNDIKFKIINPDLKTAIASYKRESNYIDVNGKKMLRKRYIAQPYTQYSGVYEFKDVVTDSDNGQNYYIYFDPQTVTKTVCDADYIYKNLDIVTEDRYHLGDYKYS